MSAAPSKLVIVESPVKAKTIAGYLGSDYEVVSCNGHVRDLPKQQLAVDVSNRFTPSYVVPEEKVGLISKLSKMASKAKEVFLACDQDREGEAIAWHLHEALHLPSSKGKRITFQEVTKKAILKAVASPRQIDMDLVNAQQARRVLDRLVGYSLSPLLWKKIRTGLSAGRVQSVAVRLVVEREKALQAFTPDPFFEVEGAFLLPDGQELRAVLQKPLPTYTALGEFLRATLASSFLVEEVSQQSGYSNPPAPFTTAALQQEAGHKLGFSVKRTMSLAQRLYEEGYITYMRTDAVAISEEALAEAGTYIKNRFGADYHTLRRYEQKNATAQEAHEAIRPTLLSRTAIQAEEGELSRLYELVWQRTVASQMAAARFDRTTATVGMAGRPEKFLAQGEVITFPGYLALAKSGPGADHPLPAMQSGARLQAAWLEGREKWTKPAKGRYTEASLVRELESRGIGRPSTYAPTITTIQQRGYVALVSLPGEERTIRYLRLEAGTLTPSEKKEIFGKEKGRLLPTDFAFAVNEFLVHYFPDITNYDFTAHVEEELDQIAASKQDWVEMLGRFYAGLQRELEKVHQTEEIAAPVVRELGVEPRSGEKVYARLSRKHGPLLHIGELDSKTKPRFASLPEGALLSTITLEEALKVFSLPRTLGQMEGHPVTVHVGKFGPYLKHEEKCYSLRPPLDPYHVTPQEAIEVIRLEREKASKQLLRTFPEAPHIQVREGRFGPYLHTPDGNIKVPAGKDPSSLTYQEALLLIEAAPATKSTSKKSGRQARSKGATR